MGVCTYFAQSVMCHLLAIRLPTVDDLSAISSRFFPWTRDLCIFLSRFDFLLLAIFCQVCAISLPSSQFFPACNLFAIDRPPLTIPSTAFWSPPPGVRRTATSCPTSARAPAVMTQAGRSARTWLSHTYATKHIPARRGINKMTPIPQRRNFQVSWKYFAFWPTAKSPPLWISSGYPLMEVGFYHLSKSQMCHLCSLLTQTGTTIIWQRVGHLSSFGFVEGFVATGSGRLRSLQIWNQSDKKMSNFIV